MHIPAMLPRILLLFASLFTFACSDQKTLNRSDEGQEVRRVFGPEEKRIARKLSIGETGVKIAGSEQDRALLCEIALQEISDQLRERAALSDAQITAFGQAQSFYQQRALRDRSAEQTELARRELETAHREPSERFRIAIGCLRDLGS